MANPVVVENITLPSLGKVYSREINPNVSLRSMTTAEEMRRLGVSDRPLQQMASIIEDCLIEKPGIPVYDMILGDYTYLLIKLRIATYGTSYSLGAFCPFCGSSDKETIDLDDLFVAQYESGIDRYRELDLPISKNHITLRMQTPRMADDVELQTKEAKKKLPKDMDSAFLYVLKASIDTVDGERYDPTRKEEFIKSLPMADTNCLLQYLEKLNNYIGYDTSLFLTCDVCGHEYASNFRITSEFFRPTLDI